jgi:hypothetical protein
MSDLPAVVAHPARVCAFGIALDPAVPAAAGD